MANHKQPIDPIALRVFDELTDIEARLIGLMRKHGNNAELSDVIRRMEKVILLAKELLIRYF